MPITIDAIYRTYAVRPTAFPPIYDKPASYRQPFARQPLAINNPYERFVKSAATGIAGFLKAAQDVQAAAKSLLGKDDSGLHARAATTTDAKKVTASAVAGASAKSYEVKASALATSQTNGGSWLARTDASAASEGTNRFKITIGGKSTTVSAFVSSTDSNDRALTKLKDAINEAKTGVTASIATDEATGRRKLELKSDKTGTDAKFEIEDVSGNAVAATGIGTATTEASNASYSVNGGAAQSSQSNEVELEKGKVKATLLAPTTEEVTIEVRPDADQATKQVKQLLSSFNAMHERGDAASGYLHSSILRSLDTIASSSAYGDIGIRRNGDGTLKLDEQQFRKSLSTDGERASKAIGGLADRLSSMAQRFNQVPASSLMNAKAQGLQQFLQYQTSMFQAPAAYAMPFAPSGLLLNGFM
ncbi:flagellar filament capping protein FliD [Cohnella sp. GCM10027633]|uniref:flagellar filament capping protein FliD n=1 Tax=unclassified Cohnella TaxID=2636738 RepID=UPI0036422D5E